MCEFQSRLRSEEVTRHLLVQQLQQQSVQEKLCGGGGTVGGVQAPQEERLSNGESRGDVTAAGGDGL